MNNVRMAIIGYGNMGSTHANYLFNDTVKGASLTAVCDTDPDKLDVAKEKYGDKVALYATAEELFAADACDAVLIATPHYDHPPLAIKAFKHNLHVLSEKPAGVHTKQVKEMNAAAEKADRIFGIMFQQRFNPGHRKIRELIQGGELGTLRRISWTITNWYRTESYYRSGGWRATWSGEGGGVLLNQCPHNLDLWQWFFGMPQRVRAFCHYGKHHEIEVEDEVTAYMEYANGATGTFITSTGEAPGTNRLEILGDWGKMTFENGTLHFQKTRQSVSEHLATCPGRFSSPETWSIDIPLNPGGNANHAELTQNFVDAIRDGKELLAPGLDGIHQITLGNSMLLSDWTGGWCEIPFDDELFHGKLQEKIKTSTYQKKTSVNPTGQDMSSSF